MKLKEIEFVNPRYGWEDILVGGKKVGQFGYGRNQKYEVVVSLPNIKDRIEIEGNDEEAAKKIVQKIFDTFIKLYFVTE